MYICVGQVVFLLC